MANVDAAVLMGRRSLRSRCRNLRVEGAGMVDYMS